MSDAFSVAPGGLAQVDGSARLTAGSTTVIVSVTGPIEPKVRQELPTEASLEIVVRPSKGLSTTREKVLQDFLRSVLQSVIIRHKYPRQLIQIVVQFLVTDADSEGVVASSEEAFKLASHYASNELSAAINCCYYALIDANVALYNSFAAVSLAADSSNSFCMNPSLNALQGSQSQHVVCFDIREKKPSKILLVESSGTFTDETLFEVVEEASKYCEEIHNSIQRPFIEDKVHNDFIWA